MPRTRAEVARRAAEARTKRRRDRLHDAALARSRLAHPENSYVLRLFRREVEKAADIDGPSKISRSIFTHWG